MNNLDLKSLLIKLNLLLIDYKYNDDIIKNIEKELLIHNYNIINNNDKIKYLIYSTIINDLTQNIDLNTYNKLLDIISLIIIKLNKTEDNIKKNFLLNNNININLIYNINNNINDFTINYNFNIENLLNEKINITNKINILNKNYNILLNYELYNLIFIFNNIENLKFKVINLVNDFNY